MVSRLGILGRSIDDVPCISESGDGRNRSVVSWMKAKADSHLRLLDIAMEKVRTSLRAGPFQ